MNTYLMQIAALATLALGGPAWAQLRTPNEVREQDLLVQRVYDEVKIGDSKARVLEVAGEPANITPATESDGEMWIYFSGHHLDVSLLFDDGKVIDKIQRFTNVKKLKGYGPPRF